MSVNGNRGEKTRSAANAPALASNAIHSNRPVLALTIEQACESLNVSWKTWHAMVEPEIKLLRLGRAKRVPVVELERWIERHAENVLGRR